MTQPGEEALEKSHGSRSVKAGDTGQPGRTGKSSDTRGRFERVCARCGRKFTTSSDRSRYCGAACKQAAYRDRRDRVTVIGGNTDEKD